MVRSNPPRRSSLESGELVATLDRRGDPAEPGFRILAEMLERSASIQIRVQQLRALVGGLLDTDRVAARLARTRLSDLIRLLFAFVGVGVLLEIRSSRWWRHAVQQPPLVDEDMAAAAAYFAGTGIPTDEG